MRRKKKKDKEIEKHTRWSRQKGETIKNTEAQIKTEAARGGNWHLESEMLQLPRGLGEQEPWEGGNHQTLRSCLHQVHNSMQASLCGLCLRLYPPCCAHVECSHTSWPGFALSVPHPPPWVTRQAWRASWPIHRL